MPYAIAWITTGTHRDGDAYITPWPTRFTGDGPELTARLLAGPYNTRAEAVDRYLNGPSIGRIT